MAPKLPLSSFPLYEIKHRNTRISRAVEIIILCLLLLLISYRLISLYTHAGAAAAGFLLFPWLLALICESWFTFLWILTVNRKWSQIDTYTYPERLLQRVKDGTVELPAVDMFVTTADSDLEPPILTVNTVLSLLAVDYPANKLACYVSDDGASPLTFYSLLQAAKFAKLWVPFCKKFNVAVRAPFQYFINGGPQHSSLEFQHEWNKMKEEYSKLCGKIKEATKESMIFDFAGEFSSFTKIDRRNHSTIIKLIWQNKEADGDGIIPNIIYISREKRRKHPHHYKAGAMNVLTRVSGVTTNAPFMLNVDCDCYVNDPKVVLNAMCILLGAEDEKDNVAFVQFPQNFYGALEDDPYGNQMKVLMKYMVPGTAGIQGPFYQGTGCFHRRKVIYGSSPNETVGVIDRDMMSERFGKSKDAFTLSAAQILSPSSSHPYAENSPSTSIEAAYQVAHSSYELGTTWGHQVGWMYGSATEDILTGLTIHSKGWRSAYYDHGPPSFLGCAPTGGPASLTQKKRWATGLMEVLISKNSPIIGALFGRLKFRQCMCYLWFMVWPIRPIFELPYFVLPAYCMLKNSHFQPDVNEGAAIAIPSSIFIIYNFYTLFEYINAGESIRAWWNNQRMQKVTSSASWLFGFLSGVAKVVGFSDTMFEVTKKEHSTDDADRRQSDVGSFTFDDSPLFLPGTTILLVNIAALFIGFVEYYIRKEKVGWSLGEVICSVWVILMYWAFLKGLFRKGKYGIPLSTILKSGALTLLFVHACRFGY